MMTRNNSGHGPPASSPAVASDSSHAERAGTEAGFVSFSLGLGSWFGAWGMQQVLFSWIVVGELAAEATWVGVAQASAMIPGTFLLLAGGAVADRLEPRRILVVLHTLAAVAVLLLAWASWMGRVSLGELIGYGLAIGTIQAFSMPARDALLSRVAGQNLLHAVTTMTAVQFGAQAAGALVAGFAQLTGSAPMLAFQSLIFLVGAFFQRRIPGPESRGSAEAERLRPHDLLEGLRVVAHEERLWAPGLLVVAVGIFFIGPYIVVFPLLVRDYYGLGVDALSLVMMLFPLGTILGSLVLRARGVARKGRAALLALVCGATMQCVIGLAVPYWSFVALTLIWGLGGAVFINCSRTLFQENAPPKLRGSVLAVYQLGFMGGAPIGAFFSGLAVGWLGLHGTLLAGAGLMTSLILVMVMQTGTSRMH